jgi:hypothetical protein
MHRLGSIIRLTTPTVIGPGSGATPSPANVWQVTFPRDPQAKFVMLHFDGASLGAADHVEIELGYDTDIYRPSWGPDFWSRPIRGDQDVVIRYVRGAGGSGNVRLDKYGRGEGMKPEGAQAGLDNTNADVFLIDPSYDEPPFFPSVSVTAGHDAPSWQPVACVTDNPVIANTARSVGMYIVVDEAPHNPIPEDGTPPMRLSSCTATLIGPDLIITAAHCLFSDADVKTGSITFDFQTDCDGNRLAGYNPRFHKLKRLVRTGGDDGEGGNRRPPGDTRPPLDYSIIQIETPGAGLGLPPIPLRPKAVPLTTGEPLFIIHHRRGTTKKVSRYPTDSTCIVQGEADGFVQFSCSVDFGSSGSSIFDAAGRIVANLSRFDKGQSSFAIADDLRTEPPPPRPIDVVLVFDRSGSMSLPGFSGVPKMVEAKEAASLFVSLLLTGASHRVGLVSFSTNPTNHLGLSPVTNAVKDTLIGPRPPGTAGIVGGFVADGRTTIGGGLHNAIAMFPAPGPATNMRAILLMTDGLENTPPMIDEVESGLADTRLNIIGFGTEASLDGPRLTTLARNHDGIYKRAQEGLTLKQYFALAFGRIFNFGTSLDPFFTLPANIMEGAPVNVSVCGESQLTVVLGWSQTTAILLLELVTPGGSTITSTTPGVIAASGSTWAHLSIQFPFAGERDGTWQVRAVRPGGGGEFPPPRPEMRYFLTALAEGGPSFRPLRQPPVYTGDVVNPQVYLRSPAGHLHATVAVEIQAPTDGTGNVLTKSGLGSSIDQGGDIINARAATLIQLEKAKGSELITTTSRTVELLDDGEHDDGGMEPDGIFGNPLDDLARFEGNYTFHAIATYGHECVSRREVTWAMYVAVGIDPETTEVNTQIVATLPNGTRRVRIMFMPRDRYGNYVGPGRAGSISVGEVPGSRPEGDLVDNGDGSYTQVVLWDPDSGESPGLSLGQPGRSPVAVSSSAGLLFRYVVKFLCGVQEACGCEDTPVRPGAYATEINISNPNAVEARVVKFVVPLVVAGAAVAREPRTSERRAADKVALPPHSATMDDCYCITQLLFGAPVPQPLPLTIGLIEIVSTAELAVSAVYTVGGRSSNAVDIHVEQIRGRRA